jgi:hypothetical protein
MIYALKQKSLSMKNMIIVLSSLLLFAACKKEVSDLPAATQTGAQTFGAKVNGNLWVPTGLGVIGKPKLEALYSIDHSVYIRARNLASSPKESEFEIYLKNVTKAGIYPLNSNSGNYAYYVERKLMPTGEWKTNNEYSGQVVVTFTDTATGIVSGTFEFQGASLYNEAPVSVTEGRFDVKVQK